MIIARGTHGIQGNDEFILLGLSKLNIERLQAGRPICLRRETHGNGVPEGWTIMIIAGETELQMKAQLDAAEMILPDAEVHIDPRLKK